MSFCFARWPSFSYKLIEVLSAYYVCVCSCVWMLTRVAQIVTAANRDLWYCVHRPTNERWWYTKIRSVWPTLLLKVTGRKH